MKCTDIDIDELYKKSMFELGYVDFILKALEKCIDLNERVCGGLA